MFLVNTVLTCFISVLTYIISFQPHNKPFTNFFTVEKTENQRLKLTGMKAQQFRLLAVQSKRPEFKSQYPSNKSRNPQLFISLALNDLTFLWSVCVQT